MALIAMIECADVVVSVVVNVGMGIVTRKVEFAVPSAVDSIDHDNQLSSGRIRRYVSSYYLQHDEKLVNTWKMLV